MADYPMISPLSDSELDAVTGGGPGRGGPPRSNHGPISQSANGGNSTATGGNGGAGGLTGGAGGAATAVAGGAGGTNTITFT
jgi:hypothetical protein